MSGDLFVSYAEDAEDWVDDVLRPALSGVIIRTHDDFVPGGRLIDQYQKAIEHSRYTLLIISPGYVDSRWGKFAEQLASSQSVLMGEDSVLPLLLEGALLPLYLSQLVALDCRSVPDCNEALYKLGRFLGSSNPLIRQEGVVAEQSNGIRYIYERLAKLESHVNGHEVRISILERVFQPDRQKSISGANIATIVILSMILLGMVTVVVFLFSGGGG